MSDSAPPPTSTIDNPVHIGGDCLQRRPPWLIAHGESLLLCAMAMLALIYAWLAPMDICWLHKVGLFPQAEQGSTAYWKQVSCGPFMFGTVTTVKAGDVLIEMDHTQPPARIAIAWQMWEAEAGPEAPRRDEPWGPPVRDGGSGSAGDHCRSSGNFKGRTAGTVPISLLEADLAKRQADRDAILSNLTQLAPKPTLITKACHYVQELAKPATLQGAGVIETQ